jgi:hypothetical protein
MKKFFLFRRQKVSKSSTFASDSGIGVDLFGVPADSLSFMTAELGKINMVFNNTTPYEDNNLVDGDSMQKSSVIVSCEEGQEMEVMESIMRFINQDRPGAFNIMKFDAVDGFSNLKNLNLSGISDVTARVRKTPVERSSGEPSTKTFIGGTAGTAFGSPNSIQGVDFGSSELKPIIDYNESGITVSAGTSINGWTNSGTGGTDYDCTTNGTPTKLTTVGRAGSGVATEAADVTTTQYFILATQLEIKGEFTMYVVLGEVPSNILTYNAGRVMRGNIYGGDDGTSVGFGGGLDDLSNNQFIFRGDTHTGEPAKADGHFAQTTTDEDELRTFDVFVMRRTEDDVIFVHDYTGEIIATFDSDARTEASTGIEESSRSVNESGRLDGNLAVKNFGGAPLSDDPKFAGHIARFGVIAKDGGTEFASKLAIQLTRLYQPIS